MVKESWPNTFGTKEIEHQCITFTMNACYALDTGNNKIPCLSILIDIMSVDEQDVIDS